MDTDWRSSLNQIIDLHEQATECQIDKSIASFQSLGIPLNRKNLCCFFDVLSSRMTETCRKVQLAYITSLNVVQLVDESPPPPAHGEILISVTSTPQADNKQHSDIITIDEDASTEGENDAESLQLDVTQTDQNKSTENALENGSIEKDLDVEPSGHIAMNSKTVEDTTSSAAAAVVQEASVENGPNSPSSATVSNATVVEETVTTPPPMANNDSTTPASSVHDDHEHENPAIASDIADGIDEISPKTDTPEINDIVPIDGPTEPTVNGDADEADENTSLSNQDSQSNQAAVNQDRTAPTDDKDAIEMPQSKTSMSYEMPTIVENNDKDSSMENDEDALYIDTSLTKNDDDDDDVSMTDAHSESAEITNKKEIDDSETAAIENAKEIVNANEAEREIPSPPYAPITPIYTPASLDCLPVSPINHQRASVSPVMSPIQSPASTPIPSPNPADQIESTHQPDDTDTYIAATAFELNPIEQELSEDTLSEQQSTQPESSECKSSQQDASSEHESSHQEPSESTQESTQQDQSEQASSEQESSSQNALSEQTDCSMYEKGTTEMIDNMINNSLKRKDSTELDTVCSAAKKCKSSDELENGAAAFMVKDESPPPVQHSNHAIIPGLSFTVPKNTNPNVHCQNASYQTRCLICNKIDPSLINHYRIAHPDSDVFISRPSPAMIKPMLERSACTFLKDGKITALCFFCEKSDVMSEREWRNHLLAHTGELEFYCNECGTQWAEKVRHGSCSIESTASVFRRTTAAAAGTAAAAAAAVGVDDNSLMVLYMCKRCNYTQVHAAHIIRHLENEHNASDVDFNRNIETVTFIPDLTPITWRMSSTHKFVREKDRFRCGFPKCSTVKSFHHFDDLEDHLIARHNNDMANFTCPHCNEVIGSLLTKHLRLDIMKHYKWHGRLLIECNRCNLQCEGQYKVFNHIITQHPDESICFRSTYIEENNEIEKRDCRILLKCKVCGVRVENETKAQQHFMLEHKSHDMDFDAIKMVKRSKDGVTSCFSPDERKVYNCGRSMACNLCDLRIKLKSNLIEHFNRDHQKQEIAMRPTSIHITQCYSRDPQHSYLDFTDNVVFYCAHCHDDWIAAELPNRPSRRAYTSIKDVHKHWERLHSTGVECKPFHFYAIEFVLCVHCKFIGSFATVKKHFQEKHPNALLAISRVYDTKACALCPYVGAALDQHIKIEHELILRTDTINPTRFTDDTLKRLTNEFIHTKYKCLHCGQIFETKALAQAHSGMVHSSEPFQYSKYIDENVHLIAGCCAAKVELEEFLNHLADRNHQVLSICSKCDFRTSDTFEFVNHQVDVHQMYKDANLLYRRLLWTKFWSTKVIFGNGLVATKHNLLGTEFDDSTLFKALIDSLLAASRERLIMNQMQKK